MPPEGRQQAPLVLGPQARSGSRGSDVARLGESGDLIKCSFCGRSQAHIQKLIAGPEVYICDECVDLCCAIMIEEGAFDPHQRYDDFDAETYLSNWVDSIDSEDHESRRKARQLLEELLDQLGPRTVKEV